MSRLKGLWYLEDGELHGSGADCAEAYTGDADWTDCEVTCAFRPVVGEAHQFMGRVQGACRSYAVRLAEGGKVRLMKNEDTVYRTLAEADFPWTPGEDVTLTLRAVGATLAVLDAEGRELLSFTDSQAPYLKGAVGVGLEKGHCAYKSLRVRGV